MSGRPNLVPRSLLSPEPREGMVMVYDYDGQYVGCMGQESWAWLLEQGYEKVRRTAEQTEGALKAAYEAEEVGDELRRENQRLVEQLESLQNGLREFRVYVDGPGYLGDSTETLKRLDAATSPASGVPA